MLHKRLLLAAVLAASLPTVAGRLLAEDDAAAKGASSEAASSSGFVRYQGEAKEIKLPGTVDDVVVAGQGRYLLLYLKGLRKIAVYDANKADVARYLTVASDDAVLAGGAEKFILVNTTQKLIERWSLSTWERETVRPLPIDGVFKTMALGYASRGPLLVHWAVGSGALDNARYTLIDLDTLKPAPGLENVRGRNSSYRDFVHIRASADGRVYGLWCTSHSPQGMEVMTLLDDRVESAYKHDSVGHICPSANGMALLTGAGLYSASLESRAGSDRRSVRYPSIPSTHPEFFLVVPAEPGRQQNLGLADFPQGRADLHRVSTGQRVGDVPIGALGKGEGTSWARHDFTIDKRVHYILQAGQVVTVPFTNDRLLVSPVDLADVLQKSDGDYFFVTSTPPRSCERGGSLEYQVVVETNRDDVSLELSAAPEGMTLSKTGKLKWQAPDDFDSDLAVVIITLTAGRETDFHTFRLQVE